jgi:hypothetical protein
MTTLEAELPIAAGAGGFTMRPNNPAHAPDHLLSRPRLHPACDWRESWAIHMLQEAERVPLTRLFTNLQQRLAQNTNDWELTYQLARLHSMAYATNLAEVMAIKG